MARVKRCFKCMETLPLSSFYKHPRMADGHLGKCKECTKRDVRENRRKRSLQYSRYDKKRRRKPKVREASLRYQKRSRERNPEKYRARYWTSNAIRDGRLRRGLCRDCGKEKVEAHHEDYSKPWEVVWLCFPCHRARHGQVVVADYR